MSRLDQFSDVGDAIEALAVHADDMREAFDRLQDANARFRDEANRLGFKLAYAVVGDHPVESAELHVVTSVIL